MVLGSLDLGFRFLGFALQAKSKVNCIGSHGISVWVFGVVIEGPGFWAQDCKTDITAGFQISKTYPKGPK